MEDPVFLLAFHPLKGQCDEVAVRQPTVATEESFRFFDDATAPKAHSGGWLVIFLQLSIVGHRFGIPVHNKKWIGFGIADR